MDNIEDTRIYVVGQARQRDQENGDNRERDEDREGADHINHHDEIADPMEQVTTAPITDHPEAGREGIDGDIAEPHIETEVIAANESHGWAETDGTADELSANVNGSDVRQDDEEAEATAEHHEWSEGEGTEVGDESDELSRIIEELCLSKADEFSLLGYEGVTGKEIWEFVSERYQQTGIPPLHRLINDILSLRVTQYMNWLTLSAYKGIKFHE